MPHGLSVYIFHRVVIIQTRLTSASHLPVLAGRRGMRGWESTGACTHTRWGGHTKSTDNTFPNLRKQLYKRAVYKHRGEYQNLPATRTVNGLLWKQMAGSGGPEGWCALAYYKCRAYIFNFLNYIHVIYICL